MKKTLYLVSLLDEPDGNVRVTISRLQETVVDATAEIIATGVERLANVPMTIGDTFGELWEKFEL